MYTVYDTQTDIKDLAEKLKKISTELLSSLKAGSKSVLIPANTNILQSNEYKDKFFKISDGTFTYKIKDKTLFIYEENDLVGLEETILNNEASLVSDFAVAIETYSLQDLLNSCHSDLTQQSKLLEYNRLKYQILTQIIFDLLKSEVTIMPELNHYKSGDVIIKQNESALEVYTLVEGKAEAFVDDVKVGEINRDEIFGMIAAITNTPRTATVIASENCLALAVPNNKFLDLINNKPHTVLKLLEDMSKLIIELNKKVVGLNNYKY